MQSGPAEVADWNAAACALGDASILRTVHCRCWSDSAHGHAAADALLLIAAHVIIDLITLVTVALVAVLSKSRLLAQHISLRRDSEVLLMAYHHPVWLVSAREPSSLAGLELDVCNGPLALVRCC